MTESLSDDPIENLQRFVQEVAQHGRVWGLRDEDGWAILDSLLREGDEVMPFWSSEEFAFDAATDDWLEYEVADVLLESFLETFLRTMGDENCLVGPNWSASGVGGEVEPADLAQALADALGSTQEAP